MFFRHTVPVSRLNSILIYDPETGLLRWRKREGAETKEKRLSSRYAGKIAGHPDKSGYVKVGVDGFDLLAHRVIMAMKNGEYPATEIDHINGDKHDNRLCNLRIVTHSQNVTHRGTGRNSTSGHKGISWRKDSNCWRVYLRMNGQWVAGGTFKDFEAAKRRYWEMATELRGEFAGYC